MNQSLSKVIGIIVLIIILLAAISYAATRSRDVGPVGENTNEPRTYTTFVSNMFYSSTSTPGVASTSVPATIYITAGTPITIRGTYTCLPHRDTSGPTTLECAFGMKGDDGLYYALDTSALATSTRENVQTAERISVQGVLVPTGQISANFWQTYNIRGAIRVNTLAEI